MASLFRWYQARLAARPILTQAITTAGLFGTGDIMAQHIVEKVGHQNHDYHRTGRMVLYGGAVFGPGATLWFRFLQNKIRIPHRPNLEIVTKVATDQSVFATANLFCFLSSMAIMEGSSPKDKLKSSYMPALARNWMVWPPVQFINFKYVPLEFRVLVVNFVALGWNCYLSYLNSSSGKEYDSEPPYG